MPTTPFYLMKKISKTVRTTISVLAVFLGCLVSVVIYHFPDHALSHLVGAIICFVVPTIILVLFDTPEFDEGDLDLRSLVRARMTRKLDGAREISESAFLGSREPRGYTHVIIGEADNSFQLFFKSSDNLLKVRRVVRAAIMSLEQCYVTDKVVTCGMEGFTAISEVKDESYKVFVYRNPATKHFRVYVHVESLAREEVG